MEGRTAANEPTAAVELPSEARLGYSSRPSCVQAASTLGDVCDPSHTWKAAAFLALARLGRMRTLAGDCGGGPAGVGPYHNSDVAGMNEGYPLHPPVFSVLSGAD